MLLVCGAVGLVVVLLVWLGGPGVFADGTEPEERVALATVTKPVPCTRQNPVETVRFSVGANQRDATLDGCGHGQGEQIKVAVPLKIAPGPLTVRIAETTTGQHRWRRPVGLLLVALSCVGGGLYAFLVTRAPRSRRAVSA